MELLKLYNKTISLMSKVSHFSPQLSKDDGASLCVIISGNDKVYAGVTGIRILNGEVMKACSEYNAVLSMLADGCLIAEQMMIVSFKDGSICKPSSECIDILCRADGNNSQCEIAVSSESSVKVCEINGVKISEKSASAEQPVVSETAAESVPPVKSIMPEPTVESVPPVKSIVSEPTAESVPPVKSIVPETAAEPVPSFTSEPVAKSLHESALPIEEIPEFSEKPISEDFSFEEKFGFDFDDAPAAPVPTLADQKPKTIQPEQPVNPIPEQNPNIIQGMNPQFVQPNNMPAYSQSQGYPYQPQGYPQPNYPYPQQGYPQGYSYPQQGYPQPNVNPQFVQPDAHQQGYSQQYPYGQQPNQSGNISQGTFPQPYPQTPVSSQPLQSVYPHQPSQYNSSHYVNTSIGSNSQPIGSVPLSSGVKSKFKQRLNKFISDEVPSAPVAPVAPATPVKPAEETLSKGEIRKIARDKKKMAKVNAEFKKRMKDLGY